MGAALLVPHLKNIDNSLQASGSAATPLTAFGEATVAENHPFIQASANYDLLPSNFRAFTATGGTAGVDNHLFKCTTGTSVGGYGAIQSLRSVNYKAGEGGMARFTGLFTTGVANSWQGVGLIGIGDELSWGYNGTDFGVWHRYDGKAEVRTLTVTGAAGGSETLTLTLNGTGYSIPLTSGTVEHNCYEIADWLNDTANQTVWKADQLDDTVIISAQSDGAKSGAYSFTSLTANGTIAQTTAGVTKTSDFVAQSSFNGDTIDGNGASGFTIDPTKGNVFQIEFQYLGFGDIRYKVEDPSTGLFITAHTIEYANANTTPSLGNPSLRTGLYCVSIGSTTDLTTQSGSMAGFSQGVRENTRNPRAFQNTQSLSTTKTNILTIRNRRTYNGMTNQVEIEPALLTIANEGGKNLEVEVRTTTDLGVEMDFTNVGTNLVSDYATDAVTVSSGRLIAAFTVAGNSSVFVDLSALKIRVPPTLNMVIEGVRASGSAADATAALTWYEDV